MTKKAENLATKEDISEITKKIEEVKSDFYLRRENEIAWIKEKKLLLLKYCDNLFTLQEDLSKLRSKLLKSGNNPDGYRELQIYYNTKFEKFKLSHWHLQLYEPGEDLNNLCDKLMSLMINLKNSANRYLNGRTFYYNKHKEIIKSEIVRSRRRIKLEGVTIQRKNILNEYLEDREESQQVFNEYRKSLTEIASKELKFNIN
ncbi:MAG: hypothetical protein GQ564_01680 [Bacteroidales bacterium]|nr:hypothetical protein [Bacteroidales bacterium]